jgi:hypothetical protein
MGLTRVAGPPRRFEMLMGVVYGAVSVPIGLFLLPFWIMKWVLGIVSGSGLIDGVGTAH